MQIVIVRKKIVEGRIRQVKNEHILHRGVQDRKSMRLIVYLLYRITSSIAASLINNTEAIDQCPTTTTILTTTV